MATTGQKQKRKTKKARERRADYTRLYNRRTTPLHLDSQEFRTVLIRPDMPKGSRHINVDGAVESLEWYLEPGDPVMHGTLTFKPPDMGGGVKVHDGHMLRLDVKWGGRGVWREYWAMRLRDGKRSLSGGWTFELDTDDIRLQESEDEWHFTKNKKRPKGWRCDQIAVYVARRYRIPLGKIARGRHYITDLSGKMSPMQVLQKAYALERRNTGRRFVIRWQGQKLNILPLRRNPLMLILRNQIIDGTLGREERSDKFATAVTVTATIKSSGGSKARKVEKLVINKQAVARYGFFHRRISGGDVRSMAGAVKKGKRYMVEHSKQKRTIEDLQHRGIAFLRRGDAIRVSLPQHGYHGKRSVCFLSAGRWQLSGGDFTMSLAVTFDDPWPTDKELREEKDKATRRRKRKKT